jgi:dipeptidyl-peptidase-4
MKNKANLLLTFLVTLSFLNVQAQDKKQITLEDIWKNGTFSAAGVYGFVHLNDGKSYCRLVFANKEQYVVRYDYEKGNALDTLISSVRIKSVNGLKEFALESFDFSDDENKAILISESEQIYRHSSRSRAWVWEKGTQKVSPVSAKLVMYPTLNPTGTHVAFVHENNLFVRDLKKGKTKQVTKDGKHNFIINGAVDWVYEEEFSMSRGFEWNANGTRIAYYRFDESKVKQWNMQMYTGLYPELEQYKYPKAGEANSTVDVVLYDVKKGKSKKLETGSQNDQYLPRIIWTKDPNRLSIQRLNRLQNHWELLLADAATGKVTLAYDETSETYIDVPEVLHFLDDGRHFIMSSERDGFNQLYLHKVEGPQVFQITKGNFDVLGFNGVNEKTQTVYFSSSEISPMEVQLFSVEIDGKNKKQIQTEKGSHSAIFSKDFSCYLHTWSSANEPPVFSIRNATGQLVRTIEQNEKLKTKLADYTLSPLEFGKLTTSENTELNYWIIKPANFDANKKYPVMMYVYGGPGSQTVKDGWQYSNYFWYQMLANTHGYIVVSVDNRGTGARGVSFKKCTYKELGKFETIDQIEAAKWFSNQSFVDASRIGIWGWSYGGYMSSLCLTKGASVFKAAIAVAPVTNWRYYDNIYTERYMRTPQENASGYDNNSPINFVDSLKGKYLIVHGTGDDNVHFQNTVEMVNRMISKNIPFDSEFYPNKNHGIGGGFTRLHLYNRMTKFILENL